MSTTLSGKEIKSQFYTDKLLNVEHSTVVQCFYSACGPDADDGNRPGVMNQDGCVLFHCPKVNAWMVRYDN